MASRLVEQYKAKAEHCEREAAFSQFPETRAEYRRLAEQWRELAQGTQRPKPPRRERRRPPHLRPPRITPRGGGGMKIAPPRQILALSARTPPVPTPPP